MQISSETSSIGIVDGRFDIDPHSISADNFASHADLQASMIAAEEAMFDLGLTMGFLNRQRASPDEMDQFLGVYGAALLRMGKLRQIHVKSVDHQIPHLVPPAPEETTQIIIEQVQPETDLNKPRHPLHSYLKMFSRQRKP